MNILVLQHVDVEHPGIFRQFLQEDGHRWEAVELYNGQPFPDHDCYDALWVMGGPQDVCEEDKYPWLIEEKAFIHKAVKELGKPYLGLCLGHQLLADALGGEIGKSAKPEIGVCDVQLTEMGAVGVFFDEIPERIKCLQWHSAEVTKMPAGATCLATSPDCAVQAMKWGTRAYSLQFHVETEADTVANWAAIPAYAKALEGALGQGAIEKLDADCAAHMSEFNKSAERIYMNWMQTTAQV